MTFKSGIKEAVLMFVLFGVPMGLLFGLQSMDVTMGVVGGILAGGLFTLCMFIFAWIMEGKYAKLRKQIEESRRVICDGAATVNGVGGWLYYTDYGYEFYPHKINTSTDEMHIEKSAVRSVTAKQNKLVLEIDSVTVEIIVAKNNEWLKVINR